VVALVLLLPYLYVTERLPEVPTMMAFVAAVPTPPPPPPPPAAAQPKSKPPKTAAAPTQNVSAAPLEEPARISELPDDERIYWCAGWRRRRTRRRRRGGHRRWAARGASTAAPTQRPGARFGSAGQIKPPQLLKRIEPEYPPLAVAAHVQGVVILEATVNEEGAVTDVRLLRSVHPLLDSGSGSCAPFVALFAGDSQRRSCAVHSHRHVVFLTGSV
jgi:protein TonB